MNWTWLSDIGMIGLLSTLIFGALSIYLYFKGRRFKRLSVVYSYATLQSRSHPNIVITFRGAEVGVFARAIVCLWNSGTEAIRSTDIPEDASIQLAIQECRQLLSASVLHSPSESLRFSVSHQHNAAVVGFSYLNPGDGGVFELLCDADDESHRCEVALVAPVIDAKPFVLYDYAYGTPPRNQLRPNLAAASLVVIVLIGFSFQAFGMLLDKAWVIYFILAAVALASFAVWPEVAYIPGSRLPKFARRFFPAQERNRNI